MKKFNWKLALEKRWFELLVAVIWLVSAAVNFYRYFNGGSGDVLDIAIGALLCAPCWFIIFYKKSKRDGA